VRRIIGDPPLLLIAAALSLYGVAMVYSAGVTDTPTFVRNLYRSQLIWLVIGLGGAYWISRSSVRFVEWATLPAYLLTLFVLCLTLVIGKGGGRNRRQHQELDCDRWSQTRTTIRADEAHRRADARQGSRVAPRVAQLSG
jgi:hypothetical protein